MYYKLAQFTCAIYECNTFKINISLTSILSNHRWSRHCEIVHFLNSFKSECVYSKKCVLPEIIMLR